MPWPLEVVQLFSNWPVCIVLGNKRREKFSTSEQVSDISANTSCQILLGALTVKPHAETETQRFSRHPFVCAVWPFRTACFMNENKKMLDGNLPVIPRPRFLHHGFRQPLATCMRKKTSKSLSLRELEPFQKFTSPLRNLQFHCEYVSLWEGLSEHGGLSPLRGLSAGAISGLQPSSLRGERRSVG